MKKINTFFNSLFNFHHFFQRNKVKEDVAYQASIDYLNGKIGEDVFFEILKKETQNKKITSKVYRETIEMKGGPTILFYRYTLLDAIVMAIKKENLSGEKIKEENINYLLKLIDEKKDIDIFSLQEIGVQGNGIKNSTLPRLHSYIASFLASSEDDAESLVDFYQIVNQMMIKTVGNDRKKITETSEYLISMFLKSLSKQSKKILIDFIVSIPDNLISAAEISVSEIVKKQLHVYNPEIIDQMKLIFEKKHLGGVMSTGKNVSSGQHKI